MPRQRTRQHRRDVPQASEEQLGENPAQGRSWVRTLLGLALLAGVGSLVRGAVPSESQSMRPQPQEPDLPMPPTSGHDYFKDAAVLPESECRAFAQQLTSPTVFSSYGVRKMVRAATVGNTAFAQSVEQRLQGEDVRLTDTDKRMLLTCLASGPKIEMLADPRLWQMLGASALYSSKQHTLLLKPDFEAQSLVHEGIHCAHSVMASPDGKPFVRGDKRPLSVPYSFVEATRSQSAQAFEVAFSAFFERLQGVASDISKGIKSSRVDEMLEAFEAAYPSSEHVQAATITLPLPKQVKADSPYFREQLGKDIDGHDKVYQPPKIQGMNINPDLYYADLIHDQKARQYNLVAIDREKNALVFKPLDADARFMVVFHELSRAFQTAYSVESLRQRFPSYIQQEEVQGVRDSERYANMAGHFGERQFFERYAPELLALTDRTHQRFVERVCQDGYPAVGRGA